MKALANFNDLHFSLLNYHLNHNIIESGKMHSYLSTTGIPLMYFESNQQNLEQVNQFEHPVCYRWGCSNTGHKLLP